ncbi:MAG TPA: hypothetical protein VM118_08795 [Acidobacteriota bacterium]|nr:hypothetical protein [Acidobacteriota bacterium]
MDTLETNPGDPTEGVNSHGPDVDPDDGMTREEIVDEGRGPAILAYVPFGCFVALLHYRENPFAIRHARQGLLLTLLEVLAALFLIPRLSEYFWVTVVFACLASVIVGIYHAVQGKEWTIPFVGKWFEERVNV